MGKGGLESRGHQETGREMAPWGKPRLQCQVSLRLMGEQTASTSRDVRPHSDTWKASPPPVLLPNRCTSLEAAGSVKMPAGSEDPHPIYRQINAQIPIPPYCLKNKIQFTEVRLKHFVRENICCVM